MYTHYMKKPKYTYTLIYINILGPPPPQLLFSDLAQSNLKVNIVHGFGAFVDKVGILKDVLHDKRTTEDVLHINETGYKILVKCIKTAVFDVKKTKSKFTTGRLYSNVTRGGPPNPV